MTDYHKDKDPHRAREAERYDEPVASREYLLELLESKGKPLALPDVYQALGVDDPSQQRALEKRLNAMERDGQILRDRRGRFALINRLDLKRGRVEGHPDGFGFVIFKDDTEDWYISPKQMRTVLHGDEVLVRMRGQSFKGKTEAAIVQVVSFGTERVVGRYHEESRQRFVIPDEKRIAQDIFIPEGQALQPAEGQIVVADIIERPSKHSPPIGRIIEVLGDHMDPGMEIDVAIRSFGIPHEWPDKVLKEVESLKSEVTDEDKQGRIDLRDLPLVTIDGEDARDFDDAVHCIPEGKGWRLWVAIADVSHYVRSGSALDEEAENRGNSVYFPGHVVPMLPELLSNGLCSLNPAVDRLCMVAEMSIDSMGTLVDSKFYPAVMRSKARLTYTEVWNILSGDPEARKQRSELIGHLEELHKLYKVLLKARHKRGAIDFETVETRIEFDESRKISKIVPVIRNDAHKLIEECMIMANVAAARFFESNKLVGMFRVHDSPKLLRLENLREFLAMSGLWLGGEDNPQPKDFQRIMQEIEGRIDAEQIQIMLLRSLSQAVYGPDNVGHFGLALPAYSHFTSPIRRYPDLLVHRVIKSHLAKQDESLTGTESGKSYSKEEMQAFGDHCGITERRADDATRQVVNWLKCEYMLEHLGAEFDGVISSVTAFGVFVLLPELHIEGLIHVTGLANDYYHFDPSTQTLVGERGRQVFAMGDEIRIRVQQVDLDERKIDFECVSHKMNVQNFLKAGAITKRAKDRSGDKRGRGKGGSDKSGRRGRNENAKGRAKPAGKPKPKPKSKGSARKNKRKSRR